MTHAMHAVFGAFCPVLLLRQVLDDISKRQSFDLFLEIKSVKRFF